VLPNIMGLWTADECCTILPVASQDRHTMRTSKTNHASVAERLMNLSEAAEFLHIDPDTLRSLTRRGRVPAMKIGRQWRFDPAILREWIREQSLQTAGKETECQPRRRRSAPRALPRARQPKAREEE